MKEDIFKINIEIIVNNCLYNKELIDKSTYIKVNEILLKKLNMISGR